MVSERSGDDLQAFLRLCFCFLRLWRRFLPGVLVRFMVVELMVVGFVLLVVVLSGSVLASSVLLVD